MSFNTSFIHLCIYLWTIWAYWQKLFVQGSSRANVRVGLQNQRRHLLLPLFQKRRLEYSPITLSVMDSTWLAINSEWCGCCSNPPCETAHSTDKVMSWWARFCCGSPPWFRSPACMQAVHVVLLPYLPWTYKMDRETSKLKLFHLIIIIIIIPVCFLLPLS